MILTKIDFETYKHAIEDKFNNKNFQTVRDFDDFLKRELQTDNIRYFISEIIRAENLINGKDVNSRINEYSEVELILKANVSKNRDALLSWKDESSTKKYLTIINDNSLDTLVKLQNIFHKDNFQDSLIIRKNQKTVDNITEDDSQDSNTNNNFLTVIIVIIGLAIIVTLFILNSISTIEKIPFHDNQSTEQNSTSSLKVKQSKENNQTDINEINNAL